MQLSSPVGGWVHVSVEPPALASFVDPVVSCSTHPLQRLNVCSKQGWSATDAFIVPIGMHMNWVCKPPNSNIDFLQVFRVASGS